MMRLLAGLISCGVVLAGFLVVTAGNDAYEVHVTMEDASGLRDGTEVSRAGVPIGKVALELSGDDRVRATLSIKKEYAPIPKDAEVAVVAANLLGMKSVEIVGGNDDKPAPDGHELPSRSVRVGTDLDQVINVLDADTRTRLSIVLNELGDAVTGRRGDIRLFVGGLPPAFVDATELVDQLISDNRTLADLVTRTDGFVDEVTRRRTSLVALVDRLGGATESVSSRQAALRQTLVEAPAALERLQRFLARLQQATGPLGPAARRITEVAPLAQDLLDRVEPLRVAALPTLRAARRVAPRLTDLADGATPVLAQARAPARALADLAGALPPLTRTLDKTSNNLLGTVDNWTRAIQFRDGMSHVFRGEASASPDLVLSAIDRLTGADGKRRKAKRRPKVPSAPHTAKPGKPAPKPKPLDPVDQLLQEIPLDDLLEKVPADDVVDGLLGQDKSATYLLDYLLGK